MFLLFSFTLSLVSSLNCIANFSDQTTHTPPNDRALLETMTNFETDVSDVLDVLGVLDVRGGWFIHSGSIHFCMYNVRATGCLKFAKRGIYRDFQCLRLAKFKISKIWDLRDWRYPRREFSENKNLYSAWNFWSLNLLGSVFEILDF